MSADKNFVLSSLLQHNFLPMQKKGKEEMPPVFSSVTLTPDVAKKLVAGKPRKVDGYQGYDAVDYKLTRFNGVSRICSIPHPTGYAHLALCIYEHWDKLDYIATNKNSLMRPFQHADGRLIIMDYEKSFEKTKRNLRGAFGRRFMAHTDVANCFASIYTHAITWATVGFDHAKTHAKFAHASEWFNQLDKKVRWLKRNETQGVAIGPATSNIVSELILARVDDALRDDFVYFRFVDDYTAYCETEGEAQDFIRRLAEELAKYKMLLNINKTKVIALPMALSSDWVTELALSMPKSEEISGYDAVNYLNLAVRLAKDVPDGSVLKYALKCLLGRKLEFMAEFDILPYVLTLSFHQPVLLPFLDKLFSATLLPGAFFYGDQLQRFAMENARFRRSDGMAWSLYYLNKYNVNISKNVVDEVIATRDCVAMIMLYLSGDVANQANVIEFAKSLNSADLYEIDQYWLLLYELYREGEITNPYADEDTFSIMKDNGVSFLNMATAI